MVVICVYLFNFFTGEMSAFLGVPSTSTRTYNIICVNIYRYNILLYYHNNAESTGALAPTSSGKTIFWCAWETTAGAPLPVSPLVVRCRPSRDWSRITTTRYKNVQRKRLNTMAVSIAVYDATGWNHEYTTVYCTH